MQPDPRIAGSAIYAWIAEDLLLYGVAYGMVMDAYAATDASRIRAWTRIAPNRVYASLNANSTEIDYYTVDGKRVPPFGIGSLIVFNGLDEGILNRAGRTIKAAAELEKAAEMYAKEPMPQMVLKSNGTNLTPERITKLLESWKASRYIDEIAAKTIALNEANKKILQSGRDYYDNLEKQKNAYQGVTGVAIGYQLAISNAKDANKEARAEAISLKNGIIDLNNQLLNTLALDTKNPFQNFGKSVKEQRTAVAGLSQDIKEMIYEYEHSVHPTRAQRRTATPLLRTFIDAPAAKQNVSDKNPAFINAYLAQQTIKSKDALKAYNQQLQLANTITDTITPAFDEFLVLYADVIQPTG